ncbi:hypothetical protein H6P81_020706 [Aristolochia fimbriata]|uniref:Geranylgeranyl transferase type II subunit beta n=1 Tax=Aristolochia fimbriata TaxID=158543 RepID=A0AAV7DWB5_ARIFI|nr:hypothetical protein H6P81_020706 [Aristolochia fimbriata]
MAIGGAGGLLRLLPPGGRSVPGVLQRKETKTELFRMTKLPVVKRKTNTFIPCPDSGALKPCVLVLRQQMSKTSTATFGIGSTMGELAIDKHVQYSLDVEKKRDFESLLMEHIRMNGAYWGLTTLYLLGKLEKVDQDAVVEWMMKCQHDCGGFGGSIGHDPHVLYTLSVVQVLVLFNKLDMLDAEKVSNYIASLQNEDGSSAGDIWGEIDTR